MRTEVEFNHEASVVTARIYAKPTTEEVKKVIDDIITHRDYSPGMKGLFDVTHANLSEVDADMVEELSIEVEKVSKGRMGSPKVALVSENALNFCTVCLFKEHYQDLDTELEVFDSLKKAKNWLLTDE